MSCDVGEVTESLENEQSELGEELVMQEERKNGWRMNCDIGEATEELENELTLVKRRKGWRMRCDVGEVTERLENEQSELSEELVMQEK